MNANDQFIRKMNVGTTDETWSIDAVGNCGRHLFESVVVVVEPRSVNPGIMVAKPMGLRGMKKALQLIEAERSKMGLKTLV